MPSLALIRAPGQACQGRAHDGQRVGGKLSGEARQQATQSRRGARKLRSDILPVIGGMPIADLHRRDVHRVLDPIKERGSPASARKVFTELRSMFNWAIARGLLDHNPAAAMQEDDAGKPRERFLEDHEIAALWPALDTLKRPVALALKLALATGQRIGEVCGMTESELDLAKAVWTHSGRAVKERRGARRSA